MSLGEVMVAARGDRTLREMARLTGQDHSLLGKIEKGEILLPRRDTMAAIAQGYNLDLEFLARVAYCGRNPAEPESSDDTGSLSIDRLPAQDRPSWSNPGRSLKPASAHTS